MKHPSRLEILKNFEKIVDEIVDMKRAILSELKPSTDGKSQAAWKDLQRVIKELSSLWDEVSVNAEPVHGNTPKRLKQICCPSKA